MNTSYRTQQVLNKVLNLTETALRIEGVPDPEIIEKLNQIIALMGGSESESHYFQHELMDEDLNLLIEPLEKWYPKFLTINFASAETRTVNVYLREKNSGTDFLIRSFVETPEQQTALNIWFADFNIAPFIADDFALYITASQTAASCEIDGLIVWDEIEGA